MRNNWTVSITWIMVLEREAPQAHTNTNSGFDVFALTLRTASGHALSLCGNCDINLRVPPIEGPARVTFEVADEPSRH